MNTFAIPFLIFFEINMISLSNTFPLSELEDCNENEFQCIGDATCIPQKWVCDYAFDCRDKSDEIGCEEREETTENPKPTECKSDQFRCLSDGYCISLEWVCDKEIDCYDTSDELNCTMTECKEDETRCKTTGHCIMLEYICDGGTDCIDNSDEENCPETTPSNSLVGELTMDVNKRSPNSSQDLSLEEEGFILVLNQTSSNSTSDFVENIEETLDDPTIYPLHEEVNVSNDAQPFIETNITNTTRFHLGNETEEQVTSNNFTIERTDNITLSNISITFDITDISEFLNTSIVDKQLFNVSEIDLEAEDNILSVDPTSDTTTLETKTPEATTPETTTPETTMPETTTPETTTPETTTPETTTPETTKPETTTPETTTPETTTPETTTPETTTPETTTQTTTTTTVTTTTTPTTTPYPCSGAEFFCHSDRICIPVEWRCDHTSDCWDGSDEDNCDRVNCPSEMVKCKDTGQCIYHAWICDGARDCDNGSDEQYCY